MSESSHHLPSQHPESAPRPLSATEQLEFINQTVGDPVGDSYDVPLFADLTDAQRSVDEIMHRLKRDGDGTFRTDAGEAVDGSLLQTAIDNVDSGRWTLSADATDSAYAISLAESPTDLKTDADRADYDRFKSRLDPSASEEEAFQGYRTYQRRRLKLADSIEDAEEVTTGSMLRAAPTEIHKTRRNRKTRKSDDELREAAAALEAQSSISVRRATSSAGQPGADGFRPIELAPDADTGHGSYFAPDIHPDDAPDPLGDDELGGDDAWAMTGVDPITSVNIPEAPARPASPATTGGTEIPGVRPDAPSERPVRDRLRGLSPTAMHNKVMSRLIMRPDKRIMAAADGSPENATQPKHKGLKRMLGAAATFAALGAGAYVAQRNGVELDTFTNLLTGNDAGQLAAGDQPPMTIDLSEPSLPAPEAEVPVEPAFTVAHLSGAGDTISHHALAGLLEQGNADPSDQQITDATQRILDFNGMSWEDATKMSTTDEFKIPAPETAAEALPQVTAEPASAPEAAAQPADPASVTEINPVEVPAGPADLSAPITINTGLGDVQLGNSVSRVIREAAEVVTQTATEPIHFRPEQPGPPAAELAAGSIIAANLGRLGIDTTPEAEIAADSDLKTADKATKDKKKKRSKAVARPTGRHRQK